MPPTTDAANVAFVPWVRQGAAAALTTVDTLAATQDAPVKLSAALTINRAPEVKVDVRLLGPGDVVGIDPQQIVRTDPRPGSADFEPNYFPAIEFDRPDFPWLFTPAAADATARLRPWLALVVVRRQDGVHLRPPGEGPLPVLDIAAPARPADELPDLAESWCWAHAQASRANGIEIAAALSGRPELSLSRLICPRLLLPDTDYIACVVPAFETGCKAGLGLAVQDSDLGRLAPAWTLAPAPTAVSLPVYHHWSFRTGAGGDFEQLVRLLVPQPAPDGLGTRPMDISHPGFTLPRDFPAGASLPVGGALQPIVTGSTEPAWPADTAAPFQAALAPIVNAAGNEQVSPPGSDPLLAPPLYGRWHAARPTARPGVTNHWFDLLNMDPRYRVVAAFGTQVVQEHQEALMASAWEQAGDLQRANQRLRQLQLGLFVGDSLHARHFSRMSEDGLMRVSAPAIARVRPGAGSNAAAPTLFGQLAGSAVPVKAVSAAMRRIVRPRGPVSRRIAALAPVGGGTARFVTKLNVASASFIAPPVPDVVTFNVVRQRLTNPAAVRSYQEVTGPFVATIPPRFMFRVMPEGQPLVVFGPRINIDTPEMSAFRAAAREHLTRVDPGRLGIIFGPPVRNAFDQIRLGLLAQIDPRRTVTTFARVMVGGGAAPPPPPPVPPNSTALAPIEPVMTSPTFPQPMYEPLRDLSQDLLLPGLEQVPPNSVIGLQTNRRFVDAYMVGLNFEMARELLWRGYPTDQRGTCFDQFWDTRGAVVPRRDVTPLHLWGDRGLGDPAGGPPREQFVMLMRSDLLRRYPTAIVYATRAVDSGGTRMPSTLPSDESYPAFRGTMEPDLFFFGFDLTVDQMTGQAADGTTTLGHYIVIQEQPTEPRFGLDVGTETGAATHLRLAGGPPPDLPLQGLSWGRNAAHMAGIVRQQPVRIAIHASQFVPRP
jgi:hypothetical protein